MNMPRTILITNGEDIVRSVSDKELQDRRQSLIIHMKQNDIDSVSFTSIHGINYYSV